MNQPIRKGISIGFAWFSLFGSMILRLGAVEVEPVIELPAVVLAKRAIQSSRSGCAGRVDRGDARWTV